MIIAAFDLATATGVCDGAISSRPRCFSWYLSDAGEGRPARLALLRDMLVRYFATQPCDRVVYEAPLNLAVMARIGAQDATVAFLRGAVGVLESTCHEHGKPVAGFPVQDARQSVLGWRTNRGGKKKGGTKKRVLDEVPVLGCDPLTDNEADAAVLWFYACALANPRVALQLTPLFRGSVG